MELRDWVRDRFVTADAVYGLILYSALIAAVSDADSNVFEVLFVSVLSLVVFWGAHLFARTVAGHGADVSLGTAFRAAFAESLGMLYAVVFPSIPLLMGAAGLISTDDAVSASLVVSMIVLGVLGYNSFAKRKSHMIIRIVGALATAAFGLLAILLNIVVH
jgi:hypothetical protein